MQKLKLNILILAVALGLFSLNFAPVFAQQMLVQILGGGYRLDGPTLIDFPAKAASVTETTTSERSIREITDTKQYLLITDENGGSTFNIQISASSPLQNPAGKQIALTSFLVKNISGTGNNVDTIQGLSDGLTLNTTLNDYFADTIPNDLTTTRVLATGSGQQPGQWKIYPGLRIDIPGGTALGIYETTITFTII